MTDLESSHPVFNGKIIYAQIVTPVRPKSRVSRLIRESMKISQLLSLLPADVAAAVVAGLAEESFLILPHDTVVEYRARKAADYDRWLGGMRRLRRSMADPESETWRPAYLPD